MKKILLCFGLSLLLISAAFSQDTTKPETEETQKVEEMSSDIADSTEKKTADTTKKEPEWIKTESGLQYRDMVVGKGVMATDKMKVECHYTVWESDSTGTVGKKIQSSKDGGKTFHCTIGIGLIKGWSEGMVGMKEGGTRQLIVPPHIGYGQRGMPPAIAPNATLLFELDFIKQDKK